MKEVKEILPESLLIYVPGTLSDSNLISHLIQRSSLILDRGVWGLCPLFQEYRRWPEQATVCIHD